MAGGVGLLCSECGRLISTDEIAWRRIDGRVVCAECFYAEQSKQAGKARGDDA
jgi:formylmethanofuran dehydrogenase subunit E